jgi:putative ubiquitin-RnfH superfamily antitoxin RatB of RatAB toxin-antitoxin module
VHGKTRLRIELAYALRKEQVLLALEVEEGATVRQVIERFGILLRYPDIDLAPGRVGVFGKIVPLDTPVRDGDRVEIYRPLVADPKDARRARAKRLTTLARRR